MILSGSCDCVKTLSRHPFKWNTRWLKLLMLTTVRGGACTGRSLNSTVKIGGKKLKTITEDTTTIARHISAMYMYDTRCLLFIGSMSCCMSCKRYDKRNCFFNVHYTGMSFSMARISTVARMYMHALELTNTKIKYSCITLFSTITHRWSRCMCTNDWNAFWSLNIRVSSRLYQ